MLGLTDKIHIAKCKKHGNENIKGVQVNIKGTVYASYAKAGRVLGLPPITIKRRVESPDWPSWKPVMEGDESAS